MDSSSRVPKKPQFGCLWSVGSGTPRWGHVGRSRGAGKAALAGIPWALWWQIQPYPEPASLFPSPCSLLWQQLKLSCLLGVTLSLLSPAAHSSQRSSQEQSRHTEPRGHKFLPKTPRSSEMLPGMAPWMCRGVVPSGSQAGQGCSCSPSPSQGMSPSPSHVPNPERGGGSDPNE